MPVSVKNENKRASPYNVIRNPSDDCSSPSRMELPFDLVGNVLQATLDPTSARPSVIVDFDNGTHVRFFVPTLQEIKEKYFYRKAKTSEKPARPPNKFFILRAGVQSAVDHRRLQVPVVSNLASQVWKKASSEVRDVFTKLAQTVKEKHSEINPGYVYKPNRSRTNQPTKEISTSHEISPDDLDSSTSVPSGQLVHVTENYSSSSVPSHAGKSLTTKHYSTGNFSFAPIYLPLNQIEFPNLLASQLKYETPTSSIQRQFLTNHNLCNQKSYATVHSTVPTNFPTTSMYLQSFGGQPMLDWDSNSSAVQVQAMTSIPIGLIQYNMPPPEIQPHLEPKRETFDLIYPRSESQQIYMQNENFHLHLHFQQSSSQTNHNKQQFGPIDPWLIFGNYT
ncbi:hypothetical protein G9A89_010429 [Geosiphon pyriformis]|nr:hypothetical protein G9A89_010429 [Geosiphon pyriformis]